MNKSKAKRQLRIDSDEQFENTRQSWAYPQTTRDNYCDRREGQTMFDFIKRRKKFAIQQEISKKKRSPSKHDYKDERESELLQTDRTAIHRTPRAGGLHGKSPDLSVLKHSNIDRLYEEDCMTPRPAVSPLKRVGFGESQRPASRNSRSLLEVLSPFRKRVDDNSQTKEKENSFINNAVRSSFKKSDNRNLLNEKILNKISYLGQQIESCSKTARNCRNRSYSILTSTIECLDELAQQSNARTSNKKRISEMRIALKGLEKLYQQFQSTSSQLSTDQILRTVKERFAVIENASHQENREAVESEFNASVQHYEVSLPITQKQLKHKDKELEKCRRDLEKLEHRIEKEREKERKNYEEKDQEESRRERSTRDKVKEWKDRENSLLNQNQQLHQELNKITGELKQLQRQNKTLQHEKAALVKSFDQQRGSVESAKQKILIQQISRLKKQYQVDLARIQDLYKMKELKYIEDINNLQLMLKDQEGRHKHCSKIQDINYDELKIMSTQISQLHAQNDKFRAIISRLESESFVLWGALKDVKVLSCRLGIFNKFSRIYDDIRFSDVAIR